MDACIVLFQMLFHDRACLSFVCCVAERSNLESLVHLLYPACVLVLPMCVHVVLYFTTCSQHILHLAADLVCNIQQPHDLICQVGIAGRRRSHSQIQVPTRSHPSVQIRVYITTAATRDAPGRASQA